MIPVNAAGGHGIHQSLQSIDLQLLEEERISEEPKSLSRLLRALFALNGLSLSIQSLSLMYIVNTQVAIPLPFLPTYGAIAFLPYSLKPMYAYLSQYVARHRLIVVLLMGNSLSIICTTLIPPGGIFLAFLFAFFRGITDAWAELCLGLTLIDHARHCGITGSCTKGYDVYASRFQAQAATMRNSGSLLGSLVTCLLLLVRQAVAPNETQLSGKVANALLITTGLLQIIGAISSFLCREGFQVSHTISTSLFQPIEQNINNAPKCDEESALVDDEDSFPSYSSDDEQNDSIDSAPSYHSLSNWVMVALLQTIVVSIALKEPIVECTSHVAWRFMLLSLLLLISIMALAMYSHNWWQRSHGVGLFLILRHAVPSDTLVFASFFYCVFQSDPLLLQLLSFIGRGVTMLSSWSYEKLLSRHSSGREFHLLIAGTTLLAAIASLSNLSVFKHSSSEHIFWIAVLVKGVTTFSGEWAFLPDVVLATTSLSVKDGTAAMSSSTTGAQRNDVESTKKRDIEYGTLISCIDFGDQIGSLITGPIVAVLGISRENEWKNLDHLIVLCSLASIASLALLKILQVKK